MKINFHLLLFALLIVLNSCSNEGEDMPTFSLVTLDGTHVTEQDLLGKITVVNVWATWCGNCLNELDELNELASKYEKDDSVFLAVSDESPEIVSAFVEKRPFKYVQIPNGLALTDAIQTRFVKTYPQHIILDQNLKISFEHTGEMGNTVNGLSKEIERLK
jgi:thiol-disulfide isomerase/thioredoxin